MLGLSSTIKMRGPAFMGRVSARQLKSTLKAYGRRVGLGV